MSASQDTDNYTFILDGEETLGADFDAFADVLYLWRGDAPTEAMSVTSIEGHLVRIDPDTAEIVGFTIFGWDGELNRGTIEVTVPVIARDNGADAEVSRSPRTHELALA